MSGGKFMRGMGIGIAVGTAIGIACTPKKKHPMKKKAQSAIRLVANCVEDLSDAMGF